MLNIGDTDITLASRKLHLPPTRSPPSFYVLKPREIVYFDFRGEWCIEVPLLFVHLYSL